MSRSSCGRRSLVILDVVVVVTAVVLRVAIGLFARIRTSTLLALAL